MFRQKCCEYHQNGGVGLLCDYERDAVKAAAQEAEVLKISPTGRYLFATMPDGSMWRVPVEQPARILYGICQDWLEISEAKWITLLTESPLSNAARATLQLRLSWSDLKPYAVQVQPPQPRSVEEMWREAKVEIRTEGAGDE